MKCRKSIPLALLLLVVGWVAQAETKNSPTLRAKELLLLGTQHMDEGRYDSTIHYLRRSLALAPEVQEVAYILLTHSFKALAERDSALFYARKVIEGAQSEGN